MERMKPSSYGISSAAVVVKIAVKLDSRTKIVKTVQMRKVLQFQ